MHGLLLVWREAKSIDLGADGEQEKGDRCNHLDREPFGFLDVFEAAAHYRTENLFYEFAIDSPRFWRFERVLMAY